MLVSEKNKSLGLIRLQLFPFLSRENVFWLPILILLNDLKTLFLIFA